MVGIRIIVVAFLALLVSFAPPPDFLSEQKKYARVKESLREKEKEITVKLKTNQLALDDLNIMLVAYKDDDKLELYAKKKSEEVYKKLGDYDICSRSGKLGPKRRVGDRQVPEGFYYIERFNPASNFYMSLGLSYPNQSDKRKSKASNLGGDIFIHGDCVTIGCMPMTDDKIKELYLYAIYARNNGQMKIPVYVFPFQMTEANFALYKARYKFNPELMSFWTNLKTGYDRFEKDKKELKVSVNETGDYTF